MGYNTQFRLEIEPENPDLLTELAEGNDQMSGAICGDSIKWYDHKDEMIALSKRFPDTLFTLYGDGEESRDLWVKYFKNGKMQSYEAEIIYPPVNENGWEEPK